MTAKNRKNIVKAVLWTISIFVLFTFAAYSQVHANASYKKAMEQTKRADQLQKVAEKAAAETSKAKAEAERVMALLQECRSK